MPVAHIRQRGAHTSCRNENPTIVQEIQDFHLGAHSRGYNVGSIGAGRTLNPKPWDTARVFIGAQAATIRALAKLLALSIWQSKNGLGFRVSEIRVLNRGPPFSETQK